MTFDKMLQKSKSPRNRLKTIKDGAKFEHPSKIVKFNGKTTKDANFSLGVFIIFPRTKPIKSEKSSIPYTKVF